MATLKINGKLVEIDVDGSTPLLWALRENLGLTGSKYGCGIGSCGACTVHIDGEAVRSCLVTVASLDPSKEIVYVATEAPEAIVMYRGSAQLEDGGAVIELPEYFSVVAAEDGIQVQITPTEDCNGIFVRGKSREYIEVKELMKGRSNARFDYQVTAVRAGFERHQPVVKNTHFRPQENETAEAFKERYTGDDMSTTAMRTMLIANGLLTQDGELNKEMVESLGWKVN